MTLADVLGFLAPATLVAGAALTAANAGARVTGYGFIGISLAQLGFAGVGLATGSRMTVIAAAILFVINAAGAHRWLRHVARADDVAERTRERSLRAPLSENIASARLALGASVYGPDGAEAGQLDDIIIEDQPGRIAYFVIHPAGAHAGRDFVGVMPAALRASGERLQLNRPLAECSPLPAAAWPAHLPTSI